MRTPHRLLVVPLTVVVAGALLACTQAPGNNGTSAQSTVDPLPGATVTDSSTVDPIPTGVPTGAAAWCALAPPAMAEAALGLQVQVPTASFTSEEIRCTYRPVQEGGDTVRLRFRPDQDHDSFLAYRDSVAAGQFDPVVDLPGVGDEAFYSTSEFDVLVSQTLVARQNSVILIIEAPGALEPVTALATQVLAQLA